jgi:prenyltransferase beta subunit
MATGGGELSRRAFGIAAVMLAAMALAAPARAEAADVSLAAGWLESVQNGDGGFGASPGNDSSAEITCWAMLGLEASGRNPLDVSRSGSSPVDFLRRNVGALGSPGDLARAVLALEGAGVNPREFGGQNLISRLFSRRRDNGSYEGRSSSTAYAIVGLRAAGAGGVEKSLSWLHGVQNDDGGWGDAPGSPSSADDTGAVLQALSSDSKASGRGLSYLRGTQHKGGGFSRGDGGVNTQSTAWAVQGILAAGGDPSSFRRGGASALDYLTDNQEPDGSFRYARPSAEVPDEVAHQNPIPVTAESVVAASNDYLPISAPARAPAPKPSPTSPATPAAPFGGITPDDVPVPESAPGSPSISGATAPGAGLTRPPGGKPAAGAAKPPGLGGAERAGGAPPLPVPPAPAKESSGDESESSATGAIVVGLAAGGLLFGAAWIGRRGWMRWRYGI